MQMTEQAESGHEWTGTFDAGVPAEEAMIAVASHAGASDAIHPRAHPGGEDAILRVLDAAGLIGKRSRSASEDVSTSYRLTEKGRHAYKYIVAARHLEGDGRPIAQWQPERQPSRVRPETFPEYALMTGEKIAGHSRQLYHTDGKLMLLGPNPNKSSHIPGTSHIDATHVTNPQEWSATPARPIGYVFDRATALIAFDIEGVYLLGSYYEIILAHVKQRPTWYALKPGKRLRGDTNRKIVHTAIRCDSDTVVGMAWGALYAHKGFTPSGIQRLLKKRRSTQKAEAGDTERGAPKGSK